MNIFQEISTLWKARSAATEIIKEAKMQTSSGKSGWKTTEFWMHVATQAGVLWGIVHGFVPAPWNAIVPIAGSSIYAICATVRKAVADIQSAKAGTPAPVN